MNTKICTSIEQSKKLLFIDICARVPYYPYALFDLDKKFDGGFQAPIIGMVNKGNTGVINYNQEFYAYGCMTPFSIDEFRIYLRPMSSMTEEEYEEYDDISYGMTNIGSKYKYYDLCDWFNKHHFDYRGLIEKNLALEAPDGMYKIN